MRARIRAGMRTKIRAGVRARIRAGLRAAPLGRCGADERYPVGGRFKDQQREALCHPRPAYLHPLTRHLHPPVNGRLATRATTPSSTTTNGTGLTT